MKETVTFEEFMLLDLDVAVIASIILTCEDDCDHLSCEMQREVSA